MFTLLAKTEERVFDHQNIIKFIEVYNENFNDDCKYILREKIPEYCNRKNIKQFNKKTIGDFITDQKVQQMYLDIVKCFYENFEDI